MNSEKIGKIWKKDKLNSEMIWKIWKKSKLNSEKIWKLWKKSKLKCEKIWKIWKKSKLNSEMIWKIWKISVLVIQCSYTQRDLLLPPSHLPLPPPSLPPSSSSSLYTCTMYCTLFFRIEKNHPGIFCCHKKDFEQIKGMHLID